MATPQDELEEELIEHGDRILVIVGAGVSLASTNAAPCASWKGLLENGIEHCLNHCANLPQNWDKRIRSQLGENDLEAYINIATELTSRINSIHSGEIGRWLEGTIGKLRVEKSDILQCLKAWQIQCATTNYDTLIEQVIGCGSITWKDSALASQFLRRENNDIFHLHGHWRYPESVVLGIRSYDEILGDQALQGILRASLITRTLIFIGCGSGLEDPNFSSLMAWMQEALAASPVRHFRLASEREAGSLKEQNKGTNIRIIIYGESHENLPEYLKAVTNKVLARREPPPLPIQLLAQGQADFNTRYRELESQRVSLSPGEYLRRLSSIAKELWEKGGRRSAWWMISGSFERGAQELHPEERARIGNDVAEMMIEDGMAMYALPLLRGLLPDLESAEIDPSLARRCRQLQIRCFNDVCAYPEALEEIARALKHATSPLERERLEAERAEIIFLQGDFIHE